MKLVGYVRVSTDAQAEHGYGLDAQKRDVRRWAKVNGHRVVRWCSDEGVSGTVDALDRDGLACVLDAIADGSAHGLVVARLDRLARKLHVQEAALAHVWQAGGTVYAADSGEVLQDDPDDPMRTAMRQMMGVFAELDRAMIAKRLRSGRAAKAEKGGYAYGAPGFGYRAEDGELVADAQEQATLARIAELRADGLSLRRIAEVLTEEGWPTKRGGSWHSRTLSGIVKRGNQVAGARA